MPSIILSDNGVSSGSAGLKSTAASDGVLVLQTTTSGGTATNAVYVTNTQRVGLGTTSPGTVLQVVGQSAAGIYSSSPSTAGNNYLLAASSSYNYGVVGVKTGDGTSSGDVYQLGVVASAGGTSSGILQWGSASNCVGLSTTPSTSGTGISFPATQSASSDANTLDDYEEGTWTVTLTASTPGTLSVSYGNRAAWYTKIGRQVVAGFYLTWSMTKGTASGDILLSGLPFTAAVPFGGADAQTGFIGYVNSFPVSVCGLLQVYTTNNMYIGIANGGTAQITSFADGTTYAVRGTYVFYV